MRRFSQYLELMRERWAYARELVWLHDYESVNYIDVFIIRIIFQNHLSSHLYYFKNTCCNFNSVLQLRQTDFILTYNLYVSDFWFQVMSIILKYSLYLIIKFCSVLIYMICCLFVILHQNVKQFFWLFTYRKLLIIS